MRIFLILFCILMHASEMKGQEHFFEAGIEAPLQYQIGYRYRPSANFSFHVQAGLITAPWSSTMIGSFERLGMDPLVADIIEDAFEIGYSGQVEFTYHSRRNLFSLGYQQIFITSGLAINESFGEYYRDQLSEAQFTALEDAELQIDMDLFQLVLRYDRQIKFNNKQSYLLVGLGWTQNLNSNTVFYSGIEIIDILAGLVASDMKDVYRKYSNFPMINLSYVVPIQKRKESMDRLR